MADFLDALGLLMVIEGIFYCLFPAVVRRMGQRVQQLSNGRMRGAGLAAAVAGVGIVFLVRR